MKRVGALLAIVLSVVIGWADEYRPPRVELTSEPVGAKVSVNGQPRGQTPLTLYDLRPGACHVQFELTDYETVDEFFSLNEGEYTLKHVELVPLKGLLLLTSEPAGCSILYNGFSLGETPRLITSLEAKEKYQLKLEKAGYQSRVVDIRFQGRTPLVKHERLILDSGVLEIASNPAGAAVMVNGIARGNTPLIVRDIPKGSAKVTLQLAGFETVTRELMLNPGDVQKLDVELAGVPGKLYLSSVPEGARFYVNDESRGKGPLDIPRLKPGDYVVRAELDGHDTVERIVTIGHGETRREEFRLESNLGRLEVRTKPANVQVWVDGRLLGTTRVAEGAEEDDESALLTIQNLTAGEHTVRFKCAGHAELVKGIEIEPKTATSLMGIRLKKVFTPNVRIQTPVNAYTGVLVENGPVLIRIEVSPGVIRSFPRTDVRKFEFINLD